MAKYDVVIKIVCDAAKHPGRVPTLMVFAANRGEPWKGFTGSHPTAKTRRQFQAWLADSTAAASPNRVDAMEAFESWDGGRPEWRDPTAWLWGVVDGEWTTWDRIDVDRSNRFEPRKYQLKCPLCGTDVQRPVGAVQRTVDQAAAAGLSSVPLRYVAAA